MTDNTDDPRGGDSAHAPLPPPAFPPGMRRTPSRRSRTVDSEGEGGDEFSEALISPDEPIVRVEFPEEAFISPDDPIERREPNVVAAGPDIDEDDFDGEFDEDDVVVTGMGGELMYNRGAGPLGAVQKETHLELAARLEKLAGEIRENGISALAVHRDSNTFDAVLRSMVAGYMAGRD